MLKWFLMGVIWTKKRHEMRSFSLSIIKVLINNKVSSLRAFPIFLLLP